MVREVIRSLWSEAGLSECNSCISGQFRRAAQSKILVENEIENVQLSNIEIYCGQSGM